MHEPEQERRRWYRAQGWWPAERLQDRYARVVQERPEGLAVVDDTGRELTHGALWNEAERLGQEFARHGVGKDDVIIILLPNCVEWQIAFVAILRAGAIPANLPIRTDADTLRYVAELVGARLVITAERHGANPTGAMAHSAATSSQHKLDVLLVRDVDQYVWIDANGEALPPRARVEHLDHIMFTSSTTGRPKAVMHSTDTLAALNIAFTERFSLGPDRPIFMASPLGHSVGAIHGARLSLYNGAALVLQSAWEPKAVLAMIAEYDCAFTAAATPFLKDLVDATWDRSEPKLAPMRWFLCGGAQVPPALMEVAQQQFPNTFITVLWGMTEGGLTTCLCDSPYHKVLNTAGVGLPGLELRILDPDGQPLPAGEEGELAMRGPGVFTGYYGQADLYAASLTADSFFRTGDLAKLDEDGYLRITGRLKDLIIRGGVNISPVPIEDALASHPNVASVAVVGFPDDRLGERICAVIVAQGEVPSLDALNDFVRSKGVPKYHCPEVLCVIGEMPMTPAGKIRKNELRATVVQESQQEAHASENGVGS
ncbi:MAG: AMP-binding protein [Gammaproteobacteria bacterium]|jgi:acyl-CoA synthetase (AMP-forming)/AMP-acid ligase II|nr:AMP-binding protein [Gammaproteobacteria bacterium]